MTIFSINGANLQPIKVLNGNIIPIVVDFTANNEEDIDLTILYNSQLFGRLTTMFVDNSTNPSKIVVVISGSGQTFDVPGYSNGFYNIAATTGSTIKMTSAGGASQFDNVQLYDYLIPAITWTIAPAGSGTIVSILDGGDVAEGAKADAAVTNPALPGSVIALLKGVLTGVNSTVTGLASILAQLVTGILTTRSSDYPSGAVPITASSGNVANAAAVATLAAAAGKKTYITGFEVTASGATVGAVVTVTVAGITGGTASYTYVATAGALLSDSSLIIPFNQAIPSNAVNTAVVVTLPALGAGNTNATVVAHGYQL